MAIAYFPSLAEADVVEVTFLRLSGGDVTLRLMIDTGMTGQSPFAISQDSESVAIRPAPSMHAVGALQGLQKRVVVCYRVGNLTSNTTAAAIVADPSSMSLPAGIHGLAGLQFLRQFRRWGAERTESGWRFYLETDGV